ncbi:DUF488 domain-containing protein [Listeria sp. ILCC792]|uniref:DUF488 domain-containing protein n=1 Tax=Listeria sp. ILCC792 TaxID=1918331 RepID=UPI000B594866|nr:DUF488 family protein [Listeria sp. ILCC792]
MLKLKRLYEPAETEDGYRILVDRLWPRGVSKEKAKLDEWARNMAPSNEIRTDFHHQKMDFQAFKEGYLAELSGNQFRMAFLDKVRKELEKGNVTFLFAAKSEEENHARVLLEWVSENL